MCAVLLPSDVNPIAINKFTINCAEILRRRCRRVSLEHWWNSCDRRKIEELGDKPLPVLLVPPRIKHKPVWDRIGTAVMISWRLTA